MLTIQFSHNDHAVIEFRQLAVPLISVSGVSCPFNHNVESINLLNLFSQLKGIKHVSHGNTK